MKTSKTTTNVTSSVRSTDAKSSEKALAPKSSAAGKKIPIATWPVVAEIEIGRFGFMLLK